jgi:TfoX/Sxy family transcriptional regulator of competence genes
MAGCDPKALQAALERASPPDRDLSFRPMFGGIMGYAQGRPFASLSNVGLALKLSPAAQAQMLAEGGERLRYGPDDPPSKSYVVAPPALLEDAAALGIWISRSLAELPAARPRPRATRRPDGVR